MAKSQEELKREWKLEKITYRLQLTHPEGHNKRLGTSDELRQIRGQLDQAYAAIQQAMKTQRPEDKQDATESLRIAHDGMSRLLDDEQGNEFHWMDERHGSSSSQMLHYIDKIPAEYKVGLIFDEFAHLQRLSPPHYRRSIYEPLVAELIFSSYFEAITRPSKKGDVPMRYLFNTDDELLAVAERMWRGADDKLSVLMETYPSFVAMHTEQIVEPRTDLETMATTDIDTYPYAGIDSYLENVRQVLACVRDASRVNTFLNEWDTIPYIREVYKSENSTSGQQGE